MTMKPNEENDHARTTAATVSENRRTEEKQAEKENKEQKAANEKWANMKDEEDAEKGMEMLDSSIVPDINMSQIGNSDAELSPTQYFSQEGESRQGTQDQQSGEDFFSTKEDNSQLSTLPEVTTSSPAILSQTYGENSQKDVMLSATSQTPQREASGNNQARQIDVIHTQPRSSKPRFNQRKKMISKAAVLHDKLFGDEGWASFLKLTAKENITKMKLENFLLKQCPSKDMGFSKMRGENEWLIEVTTERQSQIYLGLKNCNGVEIKVEKHDTLNSRFGTIILPKPDEGEDFIKDQRIVLENIQYRHNNAEAIEVYSFTSKKDKERKFTVAKIKFAGRNLPQRVKFRGEAMPIREVEPKPMQCDNCLMFGHTKKRCHNKARCAMCAEEHETKWKCPNPKKCANCMGDHHAKNKECVFYIYNANLKMLQEKHGKTIREAKLELKNKGIENPAWKKTYAQTAKSINKIIHNTTEKNNTDKNRYSSLSEMSDMDQDDEEAKQRKHKKGSMIKKRKGDDGKKIRKENTESNNTEGSSSPEDSREDKRKKSQKNNQEKKETKKTEKENQETEQSKGNGESPSREEETIPKEKETNEKAEGQFKGLAIAHNRQCACHECFVDEARRIETPSAQAIKAMANKFIINRTSTPRNLHNRNTSEPCWCMYHLKDKMKRDPSQVVNEMIKIIPKIFQRERMRRDERENRRSRSRSRSRSNSRGRRNRRNSCESNNGRRNRRNDSV